MLPAVRDADTPHRHTGRPPCGDTSYVTRQVVARSSPTIWCHRSVVVIAEMNLSLSLGGSLICAGQSFLIPARDKVHFTPLGVLLGSQNIALHTLLQYIRNLRNARMRDPECQV